jgi:hypothetical protein
VRLTNEANAKVKELNVVLAAIADEESSFVNDTAAMAYDTRMIQQDNKERCAAAAAAATLPLLLRRIPFLIQLLYVCIRLQELRDNKTALEHHISAMDTIEAENEYLRSQLIALTRDYDETVAAQEEEREAIKQRNFDSRMTMESVLRKEIQTLDTNFKVLAVSNYCLYVYALLCVFNHASHV